MFSGHSPRPYSGVARIWCEEGHEKEKNNNFRVTHRNITKLNSDKANGLNAVLLDIQPPGVE